MRAGSGGGTQLYCPRCKGVRVCRAVPTTHVARVRSGQRFYQSAHPDIHFFRRGRQCLSCSHKFLTAEVREDFLNELATLRNRLAALKGGRDDEDSVALASASLDELIALREAVAQVKADAAHFLELAESAAEAFHHLKTSMNEIPIPAAGEPTT